MTSSKFSVSRLSPQKNGFPGYLAVFETNIGCFRDPVIIEEDWRGAAPEGILQNVQIRPGIGKYKLILPRLSTSEDNSGV